MAGLLGNPFAQSKGIYPEQEESFFASPVGQGLIGALFGGAASARRGAPWNTFGAAGLAGMSGYNQAAAQEPQKAWMRGINQYTAPKTIQGYQGVPVSQSQNPAIPTGVSPNIDAMMQKQWNDSQPSVNVTRNVNQPPSLMNVPNEHLMRGVMMGIPQAANMFKMKQEMIKGHEFDPSKNRTDAEGRPISYGIKTPEGMYVGPDNVPRFAPGYAEQMTGYTRAVEGAKEAAKASYDMITVNTPSGPVMVPRINAVGASLGGQKNQPANNNLGGITLETPQQKLAKDAEANTAIQTEKLYNAQAANISEARKLLSEGATGSGAGTAYDTASSFFGHTPSGAKNAAKLKAISGWMTSNVPRMEGPQSDSDRKQYMEMAAAVGDSTKPVEVRQAAMETLERIQNQYRHLNVPKGYMNPRSNQPQHEEPKATKRYNPATGRIE